MKTMIILILLSAAALTQQTPPAPAVGQPDPAAQANERLKDIDKYMAKSRERTEQYFADRINELKLATERKIRSVEKTELDSLAAAGEIKKRQYFEDYGINLSEGLVSKDQEDGAKKRVTTQTKWIQDNIETEIQWLESQKTYELTVELPYLETRLKNNILHPQPEPSPGTVTGILSGKDTQWALINHDIVKPGDVLRGVRIVRILPDSVEFEKNGKSWKQQAGQSPEVSDWQK